MRKQIATYIANNTALVLGTTLFSNFFHDGSPDTAVRLDGPSGTPDFVQAAFDGVETGLVEGSMQVLSRSRSHATAESNAKVVFNLLHGLCAVVMPVVVIGEAYELLTAVADSNPTYLGEDSERRHEFSFHIVIRYIRTA